MDDLFELDVRLRNINYKLNRLTRKYLEAKGLTLPRFWVLLNLKKHGRLSLGALKDHLFLAASSTSQLVDSLVQDGLVTRIRDEDDRRLLHLELTEAGATVLEDALSFRYEQIAGVLSDRANPKIKTALEVMALLDDGLRINLQAVCPKQGGK